MEALKAKREGLKQVVVSRELHEDGIPHVHCYLYYSTELSTRNERFFDILGHHPNIQAAKSLKAVQAYIKKEGDFIQEGIDYRSELDAIQDHRAVLGKRFLDGESPKAILADTPALFFQLDKIEKCLHIWNKWQVSPLPICTSFIPNTFGLITPLLSIKQRHYWFWSETPNRGKTSFLKSIETKYPTLWYNKSEKYQISTPFAQFVLVDEYSIGHLTVTQLNEMADSTYHYPVKGSVPFQLPGSVILICGNTNPLIIYQEKHHELIKARFNIHCLDV